jgi:hypothetical protein
MLVPPPKFIQPPATKSRLGYIFIGIVAMLLAIGFWYVKTYGSSTATAPTTPVAPTAITEPAAPAPAPAPTPMGNTASGDTPLATPPPKK